MFTISPFRIVLLFLVMSAAGLLACRWLSVDLVPQGSGTTISVSFGLDNSSPDVVEQQVTSVLENALSGIPGVKGLSSSSGYNGGQVWVSFDKHEDFTVRQFEISAIIRQLYPKLPEHTSYPVITPAVAGDHENKDPLLVYTIRAPQQPFQIRQVAQELIVKKLSGIPQLLNASLSGTDPLQIVVSFDLNLCRSYHVTPNDLISSLQSKYHDAYAGTTNDEAGGQYFLRVRAPEASMEEIERTVIPLPGGNIRVSDVARVFIAPQEAQEYFRINGHNAVTLSLYARKGQNNLVLGVTLKEMMEKLQKQLPAGYTVLMEIDNTEFLRKEIGKNYKRGLLSVSILIVFIAIAYRKWRYLAILLCGLAVNLCITLLLAYTFRVNIHLYTIAGMAIAFGIMIDNAIVMLDYYHQFRNRHIIPALLAAAIIMMAALSLVLLLPEEQQKDLRDFAFIIMLSLAASLVVALWFTPAMHALLMPHQTTSSTYRKRKRHWQIRHRYFRLTAFTARHRKLCLFLLLLLFGLPAFLLPLKMEGEQWYARLYNRTLGHPFYVEEIRPHAVVWLGGVLRPFVTDVYSQSGYRVPAKTMLLADAELEPGNTPQQMNYILRDYERYLSTVKGVDKFVTHVSSGQHGLIQIYFTKAAERGGLPYALKSALVARSIAWGGVEWNIYGIGSGFSNASSDEMPTFRIEMKGYNYAELERQANILAERLQRHGRIKNVNTNDKQRYEDKANKEFALNLDREKLFLAGADQYAVIQAMQERAQSVSSVMNIVMDKIYYPVVVKEAHSDDYSSYDVLNDPLITGSGRAIRLRDVAAFGIRKTTASIDRDGRQYTRVVTFDYLGSSEYGEQFLDKVLEEAKESLPIGYSATKKSNSGWNWDNSRNYIPLILLLITAIFFICSITFGNLRQPLAIMVMIPLSFIGLFIVFVSGHFYFDQGGYAAFIMLGGIVTSSTIYIMHDYNYLLAHSRQAPSRLLVRAVYTRSRTIILTTIATCCGLIPFLLDGSTEVFWSAFAAGTMGGLLFSLVTVFGVFPALLFKERA